MSKSLSELTPGAVVCIVGRGTDGMVHRHEIVLRLTKTLLVTHNSRGHVSGRFRLADSGSVPYSPYGGTQAHASCQKKGQVRR